MMAVSLAVTFVLQEMDANSTLRVWGALDFFRSQVERVSKGNFVNIVPLQLGEEICQLHVRYLCRAPTTFCTSASKRGSPRSGSSSGSTLMKLICGPS